MKHRTLITVIVATLLAVTMIGLRHTDQLNDKIKIKQIELRDNSAKLQILDSKYQKLNNDLNQTGSDKAKIEQQLKELQKERDDLQRQLQAKLDAKQRDIASRAQSAVTGTAYASGGCASWMAQAGITDIANATWLINKESGCNPNAINVSSNACGIAQELPCGKSGCGLGNAVCQMRWMQSYVFSRYGSWASAVAFHQSHNWY